MLLQFVFTSLLVNSLGLLSEGSIQLNETRAFIAIISQLVDLKSDHALMKEDHQLVKSNQGLIKSDLGLIKTDQGQIKEELMRVKVDQDSIVSDLKGLRSNQLLIQEELTLLKTGQTRLESMFNVLLERLKPRSDTDIWRSCAQAMFSSNRSGIYDILIPRYSDLPFKVACDAETQGGSWTIILRRSDGSENFYRKWADYKAGFGYIRGEFFLGLDKIHAITNDQPQELLILLEDEVEVRYEAYDAFAIGDESELYKLHTLGNATGTAGDSLRFHSGMNFSSPDRDYDNSSTHCSAERRSGWWYNGCHQSSLMGKYNDTSNGMGINWFTWHNYLYSLKRAIMMLRPKNI